ncbi:hypothetical protein [Nocardioides sp. GCM10030258]|uniref:hypothetical protein n=1 Tax=unclassified Nocardioides TaxID=2615069 RepID=UPI00362162B0
MRTPITIGPAIAPAIALAAVLACAACGSTVEDVAAEPTTAVASPSTIASPSPTTAESFPASTATPASYDDKALLQALVALASDPGTDTAAALPFADEVGLGLGSVIVATRPSNRLASIGAWDVDLAAFRGHVGPFNALGLIARHVDSDGADGTLAGFTTSLGEHPHCANPPNPAPDGLAGHRRISLQPSDESIDGCLEWFTVDLFLDDTGTIDTVTLDIWEP